MPINADDAFAFLEPHFNRTLSAVTKAGKRYVQYPDQTVHRSTTKFNVINDLAFDEMVAAFDDVPNASPKEDQINNMRFISINSTILLWLKKVDSQRITSIYLTAHACDLLDQQAEFEFMPQASIIVVGYFFDPETLQLRRIRFSPPSRSRPAWYVDIEPGDATVIEISSPAAPISPQRTGGLKIIRGPRQIQLGETRA